ncbi:MAG: LPS export ABC transporter periplasmic protein LptC [Candidatus Gastranaerophilaceae bacterium]
MKLRTKFSLFFIIFIVGLSIWAFITSSKITNDFNQKFTDKELPKEEVKVQELLITETREGKKYWEVYADKGFYDNKQNKVILTKVIGNFYSKGEVVMSFEAPTGEYASAKRQVKLCGGAKILSNDNTLIKANEVVWMGTIDEIHSKGNVKIIKSGKLITYSDSSIFNTDFSKFEIYGHTEAKIYK